MNSNEKSGVNNNDKDRIENLLLNQAQSKVSDAQKKVYYSAWTTKGGGAGWKLQKMWTNKGGGDSYLSLVVEPLVSVIPEGYVLGQNLSSW